MKKYINFRGKRYPLHDAKSFDFAACPECGSGLVSVVREIPTFYPILVYATLTELVHCDNCEHNFAVLTEITLEFDFNSD